MVETKQEGQKQFIEVQLLHKLEGAYPDVPIADNVNFDELVAPDNEAGSKPFFITLPLGEYNQISRNNRRYIGDVAINAIYGAIADRRITGQRGHTAEDRMSWEFKTQVLNWVGAIVKDGVVWGKAYVNRTQEGMDLREEYRVAAATNSTVGTSLQGWGHQEWNEDTEMWDIYELEVDRIDAVEPSGVGVLKAGSMPPKITSETIENVSEAAPGELQVGDLVSWEDNGNLMRGKVNTIWENGEVEVPYSDSPPLKATSDDPIARMDVYRPNWDNGTWINADYQVVRYFSQLMKLDALPELNQNSGGDELSEEAPIENITSEKEGDEEMPEKTKQQESTDDPIFALKEAHQKEVADLALQVEALKSQSRKLDRIREMLGIAKDDETTDPVLVLLKQQSELDSLKRENIELLEIAVEQEVAQYVKVEWAQGVVEQFVRGKKPLSRSEVISYTQEALKDPNIAVIVKNAVQKEMGPNVTSQTEMKGDNTDAGEEWIIIPGQEEAS